jgi:hypothetical protein
VRRPFALLACGAAGASIFGVLAMSALPAATGCSTTQCDAPTPPPTYTGGEMIDENTYETSPIQVPDGGAEGGAPWLPYPPSVTLKVLFPVEAAAVIAHRQPDDIEAFIGISAQPNGSDANFTPASGAAVEFHSATPDGFTVVNDTCASYHARFVVHFPAIGVAAQPRGDASE